MGQSSASAGMLFCFNLNMEKQFIRLLVIDDHELVRRGLIQLFADHDEFMVIGQAGSVGEGLSLTAQLNPDVVLLDMRLPDGSGLDYIEKLPSGVNRPRIALLTAYADNDSIFRAIASGVDGYFLKNIKGEELVASLREIAMGRSVFAPEVTSLIVAKVRGKVVPSGHVGIDDLSSQETRVLAEVAKGKTNREVAAALGLSEKTVKNYLSNVMAKIGAKSRTEAAIAYLEHQRQGELVQV